MRIQSIMTIAGLRNSALDLGIKPVVAKKVDYILNLFMENFDFEYLEDIADAVKGHSFLTFLITMRINHYVILSARYEDGDIILSCLNTKQYKRVDMYLSKMKIASFAGDVDSTFNTFMDDHENYILRKPKAGDQVVELKDTSKIYVVSDVYGDYATVHSIGSIRQYDKYWTDLIVLNREPIKLIYEVKDVIPGQISKTTRSLSLPEQLPMIENASRTINVIKVR